MTGLLHRLARELVGPAPPRVHSRARLPFAPPPAWSPAAPDAGAAAPPLANDAPPVHATSASATPAPAREAPQSDDAAPPRSFPRKRVSTAAATTIEARVRENEVTRTAPPATTADAPAPAPTPVHHSVPVDSQLPPPTAVTAAVPSLPQPIASAATDRPRSPDAKPPAAQSTAPLDAIPAPIVSAAAPGIAAHPPRSGQPARPATAPPADADAPTEVHVHIGRIEVTALQDSAAPKRGAPRGKPPMSLDEYLARREAK